MSSMNCVHKFFASFICMVGLGVLVFFPSHAGAEAVSYESALVWRIDGQGDYLLPQIAENTVQTLPVAITTKGLITSFVATWQFQGSVTLEVSADDGIHYTPVANGVPLTSGFTQGTSLKWKASVGPQSQLKEIKITYADSSGVVGNFGNPELSGFKFRKEILLNGSASCMLFNYQMKIKVGESASSKENFEDIRFTLPDGQTMLPFYLEKVTGTAPSRTAEFFVKIPQLPPEGIRLYVYYGNPAARSFSDAQATFDFYDDFSGPLLDPEKWTLHLGPGGSASLSKKGLLLDAAGVTSKSFQFKDGIIEYSATAETGYESRLIIRDPQPDSELDVSEVAYSSSFDGAQHCIAVANIVRANDPKRIAALSRYDYKIIAHGDSITFERYAQGSLKREALVSYQASHGPAQGYLGLKTAGTGRGKSLTEFHWIRVRQYADPEPLVVSQAAAEEPVAMPFFTHMILALNGDPVLAEGQNEGSYSMGAALPSPFDIRIMVPSWKEKGISFDLSADDGKHYRKDCSNNASYYAGRGDFIKGNRIKYSLRFKRGDAPVMPRLESVTIQYAPGSITVLSPNGGESLPLGSKKEITWTAWDYEPSYPMKVEYSLDAGKTYQTIVAATPNSGSYVWQIPVDANLITHQALIKVSDRLDSFASDISDHAFSIEK